MQGLSDLLCLFSYLSWLRLGGFDFSVVAVGFTWACFEYGLVITVC